MRGQKYSPNRRGPDIPESVSCPLHHFQLWSPPLTSVAWLGAGTRTHPPSLPPAVAHPPPRPRCMRNMPGAPDMVGIARKLSGALLATPFESGPLHFYDGLRAWASSAFRRTLTKMRCPPPLYLGAGPAGSAPRSRGARLAAAEIPAASRDGVKALKAEPENRGVQQPRKLILYQVIKLQQSWMTEVSERNAYRK